MEKIFDVSDLNSLKLILQVRYPVWDNSPMVTLALGFLDASLHVIVGLAQVVSK